MSLLALVLAGGCGDSGHTLGQTGDAGHGGASAGAGGTTSRGGAGGGSGGSAAGRGGTGGAIGAGGVGATGGAAGGGGGSAGTGGAGATGGAAGGRGGSGGGAGGTGGSGRGGSTGGAGGAAGRGGAGGSAGTGNAGSGGAGGTAGRGGTGGGGTGGTAAVTGTGGVAVVACISVQTLDRSCTTDADCFAAMNVADCCGRLQYIGLHTTVQTQYTTLEAQCKTEWPACTCATGPTTTDDGSVIKNGTPGVTCRQGVCTTYVSACGGPCAAGQTCFTCQIMSGLYGACTTTCNDVAASSDCTNPALPRCQMGSSGNVSGKYCTAGGVMCDARSGLMDCTGLVCGANQQGVTVRNPAIGTNQCACVDIPSAGQCADCTCGEPICTQYGAHCSGYSLEKGILCSLPG